MGAAGAVSPGAAGELVTELSSFTKFRDRIDGLLRDLKTPSAGAEHPDWTNNQVLRIALKTPGDPGPPDVYPLPDLAAGECKSPSASPKPSKATEDSENPDKLAAAVPVSDGNSSNTGFWIGLGIGALALIDAVTAGLAIRSRRRKSAAAPPAYPHQSSYPNPYQQPQPRYQPTSPPLGPPPAAPPGTQSSYEGPPR
ncbi:hypothetical protein GCM10009647_036860 [Streptomyces sanglieri]|uniref:hypothetical protein n=1 Tax=Streptomyces sp. Wh19 TaxID=3076629 RepID=UPI002958AE12|nr:hypothetical protein [Streptomyces sp. Wh19]MDV9198753.1 hypothetical protein [Streptomyces sp. Wh19]